MLEHYYAKSKLKNGKQPENKEHNASVSELAGVFGGAFGCKEEAALAGQFHDFGKYSEAFSLVLAKKRDHIDHAICGAVIIDAIKKGKPTYWSVIEAINGHHSGLLEYEKLKLIIREILSSEDEHIANEGKTAALNGIEQYNTASRAFQSDFPDYKFPKLKPSLSRECTSVEIMLHTRMIFSCLVDADYSVSAMDEDTEYLQKSEIAELNPHELLNRLYTYRDEIRCNSTSDTQLNKIRDDLFEMCGQAGGQDEGLFTLTAPTGTGKTLALLHFALRQCSEKGKRRIIVVLPYLTLSEQNSKIYKSVVPDILVDNSQSKLSDMEREFSSRWTVPFIVTTTVKFFESLFSYLPTDCRKLHSIANSVILFDEAQSLPPEVTGCTLQAVQELCNRYNCTMVFSTATQPEFRCIDQNWKPKEIVTGYEYMYQKLKRTQVRWNISNPTDWETIAEAMVQQNNVCTIVNMRKHARKLFEFLKILCKDTESIFFLTTDLCADHRNRIIDKIGKRQKEGLACRVVATQCIEAGVDLDFDRMFRALAPLESIIQAAGRCNRNGRTENNGEMVVFIPNEEGRLYPGNWYHNAAEIVIQICKKHEIDINNPAHIQEYYQKLYQTHKDKPELAKELKKHSFSGVDREYELIEKRGYHVIVPYKEQMDLYSQITEQIHENGLTKSIIKQTAPISVMTFEKDIEKYAERLMFQDHRKNISIPSEYFILRPQYADYYLDDMGLQFPVVENNVFML